MSGKKKNRLETNDLLYGMIIQQFGSVAAFCRLHQLNPWYVGELINLRISPVGKNNRWKKMPLKVADLLSIAPEELFNSKIYPDKRAQILSFSYLSFSDWKNVQKFAFTDEREIKMASEEILSIIIEALDLFPPRDVKILRLKFGLNDEQREYTNQEIGDLFEISGSRVGQITKKLIRRLRHPARFDPETMQTIRDSLTEINRLEAQRVFP
jgi:RNA polymerase sigma factor (sigma-70 family)